ncbi:aldehyde dehydrogenase family 16 member A1-like isoform X2 [Patagioenas fasciata]|uniref:aldehyde dehydrogenase family 16 member A1-like isoform X2 n=1 Tax=Patagioenas fasciata TaxID=372321 RepID=UPI003A996C27
MAAALEPLPVTEIFGSMEDGPGAGGAGAAAEAWFSSHGRSLGHFVAGTWLKAPGREPLECREAATGRPLVTVPRGEGPDVAVAVETAATAAAKWGGLGGPRRGRSLDRLAQALAAAAPQLGALSTLGGGRPLALTLGSDLDLGLRRLRAAGGGAALGPPGLSDWSPLGVVALVIEGPCDLATLLGTLGAILAMGNAALLLPDPQGALLSLRVAELAVGGASAAVGVASRSWAGPLPPGLLNVVSVAPPLGHALRGHPEVTAVTVLGGAQAALWGSPRGVPRGVSPWGGPRGVSPGGARVAVLVLDSADLDSVAAALAGGLGGAQLLVVALEGALGALGRLLRVRLGALRLGDPLDPKTGLGPLPQPPPGTPHPQELLRAALEEGAEFWGPLLPLVPVRSPQDAISVTLGLGVTAASVWAQDVPAALDVADRLPLGRVWINALEAPEAPGEALEAMREFGRPPWDPPPAPGTLPEQESSPEPETPPNDADVATALQEARRAGWGRVPGPARAQVLRGAAAALGGDSDGDDGDNGDNGDTGRLQAALLRWAARMELMGGAVQEVAGGRVLLTRRPLGVVGVAWGGPRPLARALELLPPALALGNALVLLAPPGGIGPALRLRQALVGAGLPQGALSVLPGGAGAVTTLSRHRPDGLWICGGGPEPDWSSLGGVTHVWVPGGVLGGGPGQDPAPPGCDLELELRSSRPRSLWLPGGGSQ